MDIGQEQGQHSAPLIEQAWSIKDLLYGFQGKFSFGTKWVFYTIYLRCLLKMAIFVGCCMHL